MGWDRWLIEFGRALHGLGVPVVMIAPGAAALEDLHDLPFPVLLELPARDESDAVRDVAADVLIATDDPAFNRAAAATSIDELGRGHTHLVLRHDAQGLPGGIGLSTTVRVPFTGPRLLGELREGGRVRVLGPGEPIGEATVMARVRPPVGRSTAPRLDLHPAALPARPGESLVVQLRR